MHCTPALCLILVAYLPAATAVKPFGDGGGVRGSLRNLLPRRLRGSAPAPATAPAPAVPDDLKAHKVTEEPQKTCQEQMTQLRKIFVDRELKVAEWNSARRDKKLAKLLPDMHNFGKEVQEALAQLSRCPEPFKAAHENDIKEFQNTDIEMRSEISGLCEDHVTQLKVVQGAFLQIKVAWKQATRHRHLEFQKSAQKFQKVVKELLKRLTLCPQSHAATAMGIKELQKMSREIEAIIKKAA